MQPPALSDCLRTVESTVGFNPISKAVKCASATPAVLIVYDILTQDTVTLVVVFEAEFASGQYTIYTLSTIILYRWPLLQKGHLREGGLIGISRLVLYMQI